MREIEFRGMKKDGTWVYGDLIHDCNEKPMIHVAGYYDGGFGFDVSHEIKKETIGQYTGLKDKNNIKIFEGDIIRLVTAEIEEISITCKFGNVRRQIFENEVEIIGFYFVRSNDGRKCFPITHNYSGKHDTEIWEVIGNIYDNPDLLRETTAGL